MRRMVFLARDPRADPITVRKPGTRLNRGAWPVEPGSYAPPSKADDEGVLRLWASVLSQARRDASARDPQVREDVRRWVGTRAFARCCMVVGMDEAATAALLIAKLAAPAPPARKRRRRSVAHKLSVDCGQAVAAE